MIQVSAASVLREACVIFREAESRGLKTPSRVSREFRDLLYSAYQDELSANNIDSNCIGRLIGNSARWDAHLCRHFTLRFLKFFIDLTSSSQIDTNIFTSLQVPLKYPLPTYDTRSMSATYAEYGPTLFFERKTMAIKARVQIPNVTKRNSGVDLQATNMLWVNMKYKKTDRGVKLQRIPQITARVDPITKKLTLNNAIRSLSGDTTKGGFCEFATGVKGLLRAALKLLVGDPVTETETVSAQRLVDYVSLILNQNLKYFMAKDTVGLQLPLFSDPDAPLDLGLRQYRINGESLPLYLKLGSSSEIGEWVAEPYTIRKAFDAYLFNAQRHNLYNYADNDQDVIKGLLFSTDPNAQSPRKSGSEVFFSKGVYLDDFEILSASEIVELF
jgi:hypothetical protein